MFCQFSEDKNVNLYFAHKVSQYQRKVTMDHWTVCKVNCETSAKLKNLQHLLESYVYKMNAKYRH